MPPRNRGQLPLSRIHPHASFSQDHVPQQYLSKCQDHMGEKRFAVSSIFFLNKPLLSMEERQEGASVCPAEQQQWLAGPFWES